MATAIDQERPKVRVPPSWIALIALVAAGVLGALYWLGPTWEKVSENLNGTGKISSSADAPAVKVPDSQVRDSSPDPAATVAQLKEARLSATLSLLQIWGFFRSASVEQLADRDPARLIRESGLQSARLPVEWDLLERLDYPCLLDWKESPEDFRHAVVLVGLTQAEAVIVDPLAGRRVVHRADLSQHVDGEALVLWKALPGIKVPLRARKGKDPVVTALQRSLKKQGLLAGPVTGGYDAATRAAVIRLQARHGLKATGVFGVRSYMVLSKLALGVKAPSLKAGQTTLVKEKT